MRIDVRLDAPLREARDRAATLAATGVDGLYTSEGPADAFPPLTLAADGTDPDGPRLGTNVALALTRSPMHLAYLAFDLQRLSGGRFALGLGSQVRAHVERRFGAAWERPVGRMRETLRAIRAIFRCWQEDVELDYVGEHTRHTLMPPLFDPGPLEAGPPPVLAAAVGPQMTRMVAEEADGLLVHPMTSAAFLAERTLPLAREGLAAAGRDGGDLEIVGGAIVGVHAPGDDPGPARRAVRGLLAFYGSTPAYRVVLDHHGAGELQPALRELTRQQRWEEMSGLVDDDLVGLLAVVGPPARVAARLAERYAGLADRLALTVPHQLDERLLGGLVAALADRPGVTGGIARGRNTF